MRTSEPLIVDLCVWGLVGCVVGAMVAMFVGLAQAIRGDAYSAAGMRAMVASISLMGCAVALFVAGISLDAALGGIDDRGPQCYYPSEHAIRACP